jgi:hypothetical protein
LNSSRNITQILSSSPRSMNPERVRDRV